MHARPVVYKETPSAQKQSCNSVFFLFCFFLLYYLCIYLYSEHLIHILVLLGFLYILYNYYLTISQIYSTRCLSIMILVAHTLFEWFQTIFSQF